MGIKAVIMERSHLEEVCGIEQEAFSVPWSKEEMFRDFELPHSVYFVALDENGRPVGYANLWHIINEGHINNIAVSEPYRRRGVGSALIEAMLEEAVKREMIGLTLEVREGNRAAMALYHKYGFKAEGYRKNYYKETKEDAVIMWKHID